MAQTASNRPGFRVSVALTGDGYRHSSHQPAATEAAYPEVTSGAARLEVTQVN